MAAELARFGSYALVRKLGRGDMAETFVATREGPGDFTQTVCVKRILRSLEDDQTFVDQFSEEARVSASLRHANIVTVLDFGVADGLPYLALELVDGIDLYGLLEWLGEKREPLTSGLVVYVAGELASALDFAHTRQGRPVVHRDISPSNVLLSRAGEVKLSDFGIARVLQSTNAVTSTATVKGKVPYMAPEYALSGSFDVRADLFALGVTLYEALAGRRPYDGRTDLDTLYRIQSGNRTPLAELCPSAPAALVVIIERLILPDPAARFQSASELIDALIEIAPPPTSRKILGDLVRRATGSRGSEPELHAAATQAAGAPLAVGAPSDPTPAGPADRTRTRGTPEPLQTEVVSPRMDTPKTTDAATTRTALAPDVIAALQWENGRTIPETVSPAHNDPELRAALDAGPVTLPVSRVPLYVGAVVAIATLCALGLLALRFLS